MTLPAPDEIAVRDFAEKPGKTPIGARPAGSGLDEPSPWTLVFDTETTTDPAQSLRVGFYQVRNGKDPAEEGAFYDPDTLDAADQARLAAYCEERGLTLRTVAEFRETVFLKIGYDLGGAIVGFNLPFDISRIAISHGSARGSMRSGFSFEMSRDRTRPRVRVKHLSRRASLIDFALPGAQELARSARKRGMTRPKHRGYFIDVKTLAAALTSRSFSLESLCDFLDAPTRKRVSEDHGGPLTADYLDYARADVQSTWECFAALSARYAEHDLATGAHRILSEASIGKAYLGEFGIKPLLACQDVPRDLFGRIMCAYYGGRAEVRIRREVREIISTDFKSMYPTVNALMGLWAFVIAEGFTWREATDETRRFLETVERDDFQDRETWRELTTLVRIRPDDDLVPTRAKYDTLKTNATYTIGLNYLTFDGELWYTLADVVAAKLLSGKAPEIIEAIRFEPGKPQSGLKPKNLFGKAGYRIDPLKEDAFTRLIDLRDDAKAKGDQNEKAIKIIANAASYGIFIEIQRDNAPKKEPSAVYGPNGFYDEIESTALEEPGKYFHPLLGVLITGAARLMLAIAERVTLDEGLAWAFCDTDSLAIARPKAMSRETFHARARRVLAWFDPLNPYRKSGSILQVEDVNHAPEGGDDLRPLYAFAVSAKRYALFNLDAEGRPVIRKASAHGLGHLIAPYGEDDPAPGVPEPVAPLHKLGVTRWQYDLWYMILTAALGDRPHQVPMDYHPALAKPAARRYGATSPDLLKWMDPYNEDRAYADQVKPFGFMVSFTAREGLYADPPPPVDADPHKRGRPKKTKTPKPIAPFERDPAEAARQAFDRETGEPVAESTLKTYAEVLGTYHLSPEAKFENGGAWDSGETFRRHVHARKLSLIGKEANGVGEFGERVDPTELMEAVFGYRDNHR
ncbi:hypothetical protein DDZ18_09155 [Marinicauda salina]|uniref:Uncharacterized protein n=2 Tax=Marinicauda salina TaxID=2135793 RepID=A0A2U2BUU3_9PROT|nr:hypothetical protein DDZ18_09155 [Marinicauda salina]